MVGPRAGYVGVRGQEEGQAGCSDSRRECTAGTTMGKGRTLGTVACGGADRVGKGLRC